MLGILINFCDRPWGGGCCIYATCSDAEHRSPRLMSLIAHLPVSHPSIWMHETSMCTSMYLPAKVLPSALMHECGEYNEYSLLLLSLKEDGFALWIFPHSPLTCGCISRYMNTLPSSSSFWLLFFLSINAIYSPTLLACNYSKCISTFTLWYADERNGRREPKPQGQS